MVKQKQKIYIHLDFNLNQKRIPQGGEITNANNE